MTTSIWYVDSSRTATNWGTAVSGGKATQPIHKITVIDGIEALKLKYATGDAVSSAAVTAAQAETTGGAVPAVVAKKANFGPSGGDSTYATVAGVTGAVTVNGKLADVIELALTGNISSFDISGKGGAGRLLEVHFKQDGTGSRTLSSVNSNIKLAGGALTLSTGANKRDVLRFRNVGGGVLVEVGRSLNL